MNHHSFGLRPSASPADKKIAQARQQRAAYFGELVRKLPAAIAAGFSPRPLLRD